MSASDSIDTPYHRVGSYFSGSGKCRGLYSGGMASCGETEVEHGTRKVRTDADHIDNNSEAFLDWQRTCARLPTLVGYVEHSVLNRLADHHVARGYRLAPGSHARTRIDVR